MVLLGGSAVKAEERVVIRHDTERMTSSLAYPRLGHTVIDAALAHFAEKELERLTWNLEEEFDQIVIGQGKLVHLEGSYTLFRPSSRAVSILFELSATSPHWQAPRRYFATRSYRLPTGDALPLAGVFENFPEALKYLSFKCSPALLAQILEQSTQERAEMVWFLRTRLITPGYPMPDGADIANFLKRGNQTPAMRLLEGVVRGTRAEAENYKHFVLTPEGLRIQFEPLQLGGPEVGAPCVDLSLKDLRKARPHLELWGK